MSARAARLARVPATIVVVWAILAMAVPAAMTLYTPYLVRPGIQCVRSSTAITPGGPIPPGVCVGLAELYHLSFADLLVDAMFRSLALLVGAAMLALILGTLLGVVSALLRRRAFAGLALVGVMTMLMAVPSFFIAYFLQVLVIVLGASAEGTRLLPVFGFGYDDHLVLPLLSIALPAVTYTAQLTATRMQEVLDSDFITTATAKGLRLPWILGIHVLPHVRPMLLEGLASGLRVSVASLPIVEFLFNWRGIGQLALEAVGVQDAAGFVFSAVVLAGLFATLSALADLARPQPLFRPL
jgi:ABC-type dipeptide/oligopeptide/nickel transport system permease component